LRLELNKKKLIKNKKNIWKKNSIIKNKKWKWKLKLFISKKKVRIKNDENWTCLWASKE